MLEHTDEDKSELSRGEAEGESVNKDALFVVGYVVMVADAAWRRSDSNG